MQVTTSVYGRSVLKLRIHADARLAGTAQHRKVARIAPYIYFLPALILPSGFLFSTHILHEKF
jgi:hypothetical protein